jgi:hypothetical protein
MGHIAHLTRLGQYWNIFFFLYAFYFFCGHYTISCIMQGRSLPGNPTGLYLWFRGGDLNSFRDNRALPVYEGTSVGPPCMVMTCILSDATWQETRIYIVFRGWESQWFLRYYDTSCLRGTEPPCAVMICIPSDATWHKKQKYIWFRVGDLNTIQDIWALLVYGEMGPPPMVMTYILSDAPWYKE